MPSSSAKGLIEARFRQPPNGQIFFQTNWKSIKLLYDLQKIIIWDFFLIFTSTHIMQYHFLLYQPFVNFSLYLILTPWKKVTFDKLEVAQLFREFSPEVPWPCSQQTNTDPYPGA